MKEEYNELRKYISSSIDYILEAHDKLCLVRDDLDFGTVVSGKGIAHDDISECLELLDEFIVNIDSFNMFCRDKIKEFD